MPSCAVATCPNNHRKESVVTCKKPHFHSFPKGDIGAKWEAICKRKDKVNRAKALICSDHFKETDYERNLQAELLGLPVPLRLKNGVVPSLFLPNKKIQSKDCEKRNVRLQNRERKSLVKQILQENDISNNQNIACPVPCLTAVPVSSVLCVENPKVNLWKQKNIEERKIRRRMESQLRLNNLKISKLEDNTKVIQAAARHKIHRYQKQINNLQTELRKTDVITSIFSKTQLKRLQGKSSNWTLADIRKCLGIISVSQKAYRILRESWNIPLPSESTLQRWLHKYKILPGVISPVMILLKELSCGMTGMEKLCILSFDEMSVTGDVDWDKSTDTIYGPHSKAQVSMLSGICMNWKQLIYYDFDTKMSKELLFQLLEGIYAAGLNVKAVVCDMGGTNQELLKELEITHYSSSFKYNANEIHVFADFPHLIKLLRNHLIDTGCVVNGVHVNKKTMEKMVQEDCGEIRLCPKLTWESINLSCAERMRVAPAVHLFSHRAAKLAELVFQNQPGISTFLMEINDLFDIFNSRVPDNYDKEIKSGFGLKLQQQLDVLQKVEQTVKNMRCLIGKPGKLKCRTSMITCQRGILMSISSLRNLYNDLNLNHGVTYILTRRLHQDPLESLFSVIRSLGRTNDNPSPSSFNSRIKILLFGSKLKPPKSSNVEFIDDHISFTTSRLIDIATTTTMQIEAEPLPEENMEMEEENEENVATYQSHKMPLVEFHEDGVHYIAGYLASALKRKYKIVLGEITRRSPVIDVGVNWIQRLSRGGMMIPCDSLFSDVKNLENYFNKHFPFENLVNRPDITKIVCEALKRGNPTVEDLVISEYVKVRIKIRIKFTNDERKSKRFVKKTRKSSRKSKQFAKSH